MYLDFAARTSVTDSCVRGECVLEVQLDVGNRDDVVRVSQQEIESRQFCLFVRHEGIPI